MRQKRDLEQARLVAAARAGSRSAYAALVEAYRHPLYRFLRMRVGQAEDAEELLQDALLRAWTQLHRFDAERSFSAWLYTLASRIAVSHGRRPALPVASERELEDLASGVDPADAVEHSEAGGNLWDLAARVLGEAQRSALWLAYGEGRTAREIGLILGRSEVAVRVILCRARKRLGQHLRSCEGVVSR